MFNFYIIGLSHIEIDALTVEIPRKARYSIEDEDIIQLRLMKKKVQSKFQLYTLRIRDAMFPSKKRKAFE
jgi:hypothetical protein